jgi:hypothetical protein
MRVSVSRRKKVAEEGKIKEVKTRSYHCQTCHTFVRSEELDALAVEK